MREFISVESIALLSNPAIIAHYGPCPWDDCVRSQIKGREVLFNGEVRVVKSIEAYAKLPEPILGESIGLIFY